MSEELKPCPFCGGDDVQLLDGGEFFTSSIVCHTCWVEVVEPSATPMVDAGNRRAPSPDMREAMPEDTDVSARLAKAERALEEAREVIELFAQRCSFVQADDPDDSWIAIRASHLRAARKWMEEHHD